MEKIIAACERRSVDLYLGDAQKERGRADKNPAEPFAFHPVAEALDHKNEDQEKRNGSGIEQTSGSKIRMFARRIGAGAEIKTDR